MRIKLTKAERASVRKWLDEGITEHCPFMNTYRSLYNPKMGHRICRSWFPRCIPAAENRYSGRCPCYVYTLETVLKRAREMVK
jgi:hypothetical protein